MMDPSRILVKGPEFLRKQIERESDAGKGRVSAMERLAATKIHYVKSQQSACCSEGSVTSTDPASTSSPVLLNEQDSGDDGVNVKTEQKKSPEGDNNVVRRISSKKRDSILLYRQKCDLRRDGVGRKLVKKSLKSLNNKAGACPQARDSEGHQKEGAPCATRKCGNDAVRLPLSSSDCPTKPDSTPEEPKRAFSHLLAEPHNRRGVARSSSDISSRYSKNFANFDAFFKYCGLDGDVIDSLGKENFSARSDEISCNVRSVSVSRSEDAQSGSSDGLQVEELRETSRQGSSVVERNARIIKWLYSCRNAAESGKTLRDLD